jgi:hypothetical protein
MSIRPPITHLPIVACLAVAVAGCGGAAPKGATDHGRAAPVGREAVFRRELDTICRSVKRSFAAAGWNGGAINAQGYMGIGSLESAKPPPSLAPAFRQLLADLKLRHDARSYGGGNAYPKLFAAYKRKYRRYERRSEADAKKLGLRYCPWPMAPPGRSVFSP